MADLSTMQIWVQDFLEAVIIKLQATWQNTVFLANKKLTTNFSSEGQVFVVLNTLVMQMMMIHRKIY